MKRRFLLLTISMISVAMASAQKEKTVVPAPAKTAFEKAFPGSSKVKWGKEKTDYEVEFILNGEKMSALYDGNGVLKETEEDIKITALPIAVTEYIKQHYAKAGIKEAAKITKPGGEINYEAEVNKMDLIFDVNGKFIHEQKDAN